MTKSTTGYPYFMSPDQQEVVRSLLRIEDNQELLYLDASLRGFLFSMRYEEQLRENAPNPKDAKRWLEGLVGSARKLAGLLKRYDKAGYFLSTHPHEFQRTDDQGVYDPDASNAGRLEKLSEFVAQIEQVANRSEDLLKNEGAFRSFFDLPQKDQIGRSFVTSMLWPALFTIWEAYGRRVGYTINGPLETFVHTIHDAAGLPEPNANTLRDSIRDWNSGGERPDFAWLVSWRTAD